MDDHTRRITQSLVDMWENYRIGTASLLDLARVADQILGALDNSDPHLVRLVRSAANELESAYYATERAEHTSAAIETLQLLFETLGQPLERPCTVELLLELLGGAHGDAAAEAFQALTSGASHAVWFDGPGSTAEHLRTIYRRREEHTRRIGLNTIGFREAVKALAASDAEDVHLAEVKSEERTYVLFVRGSGESLLACVGVPTREAPPLR